jgi:lipopolysaccharide export LptBFGC system permease protein LptF
MSTAASVGGWSLFVWLLVIAVIGLCGWWLFRRRRS